MSRLAKKPIILPAQVSVEKKEGFLSVKGPKGELKIAVLPLLKVELNNDNVLVSPTLSLRQSRANAGTMWSLLKNAVEGATRGFSRILEMEGIGYRAAMEGRKLLLSIGYVHPVPFDPPEGVSVSVEKNTIKIEGLDKALVGRVASEIRALKKPEPYKGKGIRYRGEVIKRKAGKKAIAAQ